MCWYNIPIQDTVRRCKFLATHPFVIRDERDMLRVVVENLRGDLEDMEHGEDMGF